MKLASLKSENRDGKLIIVSKDLSRAVFASNIAETMIEAVENWDSVSEELQQRYTQLNENQLSDAFDFDPKKAAAPLPRCHQFVDASAFLNHGGIMERAYNLEDKTDHENPILIQRQSDDFHGPHDDYYIVSEDDQCDFEGEFAIITGDISMGATEEEAASQIKLVTILNDISMRGHLLREVKRGFGLIKAKTATVFAPVAVTPDELGDAWSDERIHLDLLVKQNGEWFGQPNGREMDYSFGYLLKCLAYNRNLKAGLILGSGTVSNQAAEKVGSACLAETRALNTLNFGEPKADFMRSGDSIRMEALDAEGVSMFGAIDHKILVSK
jgi:fumarylacetoacetate (FAA) hydrolase